MKIHVTCSKDYDIYLEKGLLEQLHDYIDCQRKIFIISDDNVPECYQQTVSKQFPNSYLHIVKHGEGAKSFAVLEDCLTQMLRRNFSRKDLVIALGGGVIGDLAGFVAASYMRGIDFINIPTTTLSQIDSSIGGKVAINLDGIKNCVGAFYQPEMVLIDPLVLNTLPKRHFYNGLVEAIKAGLIQDKELFELFQQEELDIEQIIYRSLLVKKYVVEQDETEQGLRKILNFGHTIGHAYESYYHLRDYYHGECVALGMMAILKNPEIKERLSKILERLQIDTTCDAKKDKVFTYLGKDKKADHDQITIVKVEQIGHAELEDIPITDLRTYL